MAERLGVPPATTASRKRRMRRPGCACGLPSASRWRFFFRRPGGVRYLQGQQAWRSVLRLAWPRLQPQGDDSGSVSRSTGGIAAGRELVGQAGSGQHDAVQDRRVPDGEAVERTARRPGRRSPRCGGARGRRPRRRSGRRRLSIRSWIPYGWRLAGRRRPGGPRRHGPGRSGTKGRLAVGALESPRSSSGWKKGIPAASACRAGADGRDHLTERPQLARHVAEPARRRARSAGSAARGRASSSSASWTVRCIVTPQ